MSDFVQGVSSGLGPGFQTGVSLYQKTLDRRRADQAELKREQDLNALHTYLRDNPGKAVSPEMMTMANQAGVSLPMSAMQDAPEIDLSMLDDDLRDNYERGIIDIDDVAKVQLSRLELQMETDREEKALQNLATVRSTIGDKAPWEMQLGEVLSLYHAYVKAGDDGMAAYVMKAHHDPPGSVKANSVGLGMLSPDAVETVYDKVNSGLTDRGDYSGREWTWIDEQFPTDERKAAFFGQEGNVRTLMKYGQQVVNNSASTIWALPFQKQVALSNWMAGEEVSGAAQKHFDRFYTKSGEMNLTSIMEEGNRALEAASEIVDGSKLPYDAKEMVKALIAQFPQGVAKISTDQVAAMMQANGVYGTKPETIIEMYYQTLGLQGAEDRVKQ